MEEELEEQKEALERDYHQKMEKMREELEKKNEEDRARFMQELDDLKQQVANSSQSDNNSRCDSEDEVQRNSAYELMQSIVYTPVVPRKWSRLSLEDRVVEGRERDVSLSPYRFSPDINGSLSSDSSGHSPGTSPENRHRKMTIIEHEIDEDTLGVELVNLPGSPEMDGFHMINREDANPTPGDPHRRASEDVDSGAAVSTPTISTTSV